MPTPAIAIHGSGPRGTIARAVDSNLEGAGLHDRVETMEFDWDRVVPRTSYRGARNLYRFLERNAANINAASHAGMEFGAHYADGVLGLIQVHLHRLLRWVVAALVTLLLTEFVAEIVAMAPAAWYGLPTATFPPLEWMAAAVGWSKWSIAVGVTALIGLAGLRLVFTLSPRPAIITFRSIALLLLRPVLIIALAALVADAWMVWAFFGAVALSSYFGGGIVALVPWVVTLAVLLGLRASWTHPSLRGPIKVMLDVFRYLGEPEYRPKVQQALDKAIEQGRNRTGENEQFVLVGQGLGSVIALDSVMHSPIWRRTDRVLLVTMGSPLRRYLLPFYPRTLFPESMQDVVDMVAGRLGELRWMNIYRPGDYVGGDLDLASFNGRDISTGQHALFIGHADYWRDIEARRAFRSGAQRLEEVEALRVPMKDAAHRMPHPPTSPAEFQLPARVRPVLGAAVSLATYGGMLWWVATGLGVLSSGTDSSLETLDRAVVVDAAATYRRETVERNRGYTYVDHWKFEFTDAAGMVNSVRVERDAGDAFLDMPHPFDERALARHIRDGCTGAGQPSWWPTRSMQAPCTLQGVRLRYYPGNLTLFDLPDYPRERFGSDPVRGWTEAAVVAGVLSALILIPMMLGARVFVLFVA